MFWHFRGGNAPPGCAPASDCYRKSRVWNKWRLFGATLHGCPPNRWFGSATVGERVKRLWKLCSQPNLFETFWQVLENSSWKISSSLYMRSSVRFIRRNSQKKLTKRKKLRQIRKNNVYRKHTSIITDRLLQWCRRQGCRGCKRILKILIWWKSGQNP